MCGGCGPGEDGPPPLASLLQEGGTLGASRGAVAAALRGLSHLNAPMAASLSSALGVLPAAEAAATPRGPERGPGALRGGHEEHETHVLPGKARPLRSRGPRSDVRRSRAAVSGRGLPCDPSQPPPQMLGPSLELSLAPLEALLAGSGREGKDVAAGVVSILALTGPDAVEALGRSGCVEGLVGMLASGGAAGREAAATALANLMGAGKPSVEIRQLVRCISIVEIHPPLLPARLAASPGAHPGGCPSARRSAGQAASKRFPR